MKEKDRDNPGIEEIINEKDSNIQKEKYNEYVKNMTPKNNGFLKRLPLEVQYVFLVKYLVKFINQWEMMTSLLVFIVQ